LSELFHLLLSELKSSFCHTYIIRLLSGLSIRRNPL
jgi:hypothetical protein